MKTIIPRRGLYAPEPLEARIAPATITVTNLQDAGAGSLRQAILDANDTTAADTIKFQAGLTGTLELTSGELAITENLSIVGPGIGKLIIDAGQNSRIFDINDGSVNKLISTTLSGMSLINGKVSGNGGAILTNESLNLKKVLIANSYAGTIGGALAATNTLNDAQGTVTINGCTFISNGADLSTGAILVESKGNITITKSVISGNQTNGSCGGLYLSIAESGKGDILLKNVTVTNNTALDSKGGLGLKQSGLGGLVTISKSTISHNEASNRAGGIFIKNGAVALSDSAISGNTAGNGNGGGVYLYGGSALSVSKSTLSFNTVQGNFNGGAVFSNSLEAVIKVTGSILNGNRADGSGAAISVENQGQLSVKSSVLSGNSVNGGVGGAISGFTGSTIKVTGSTFDANVGGDDGGAIGIIGTGVNAVDLSVKSSTFTNNRAQSDGGAISINSDGTVNIASSQFFDNSTINDRGGALYAIGSGTLSIAGSTFARNQSYGSGGAIYTSLNTTISKSQILNNATESRGGGIFQLIGNLTLKTSNISGNSALEQAGGVYFYSGGTHQIVSSVISGNTAPLGTNTNL